MSLEALSTFIVWLFKQIKVTDSFHITNLRRVSSFSYFFSVERFIVRDWKGIYTNTYIYTYIYILFFVQFLNFLILNTSVTNKKKELETSMWLIIGIYPIILLRCDLFPRYSRPSGLHWLTSFNYFNSLLNLLLHINARHSIFSCQLWPKVKRYFVVTILRFRL